MEAPQMYTSMEVEYDSDEDLQDVGNELTTWLAQLNADSASGKPGDSKPKNSLITQSHTMESFRCSVVMDMDNGGNGGDLDDIINDLCALEAELADAQKEYHTKQPLTDGDSGNVDDMFSPGSQTIDRSSLSRKSSTQAPSTQQPNLHVLKLGTPLPTYDRRTNTLDRSQKRSTIPPTPPPKPTTSSKPPKDSDDTDRDQRAKEEKIKIAIQKIKAADIKKLFVKVFIQNGECKTILVDEKMAVSEVLLLLYEKCEVKPNVRWTLVEQIPDLFIERIIEDHEKLITVMMNWLKISNNKILFLETDDKYDLFFQPQKYLLSREGAEKCTEKEQKVLLDELFGGAGTQVPEMEGEIYHKVDGQKTWKKIPAVLRTSGIYTRKGKSSRNMQCITSFDQVEIYRGFGWKKKFKAPTEHCFALKHPKLQKKSKDIRYFCCEDEYTLKKWLTGMRIAKYGKELQYGFKHMLEIVSGNRKPSSGTIDTPSDSMSQSSRDSGFSVTSDSSNSLDNAQSAAKKHRNAGMAPPPPPDEFSDLPPPPPELLTEEPTPTNTPVHFASQLSEDFSRMHTAQSMSDDNASTHSSSSSSVSNSTPRNSITSNHSSHGTPAHGTSSYSIPQNGTPARQPFERCSAGIRNSLRKGQLPTPPKPVAPPKVPEKTHRPPTQNQQTVQHAAVSMQQQQPLSHQLPPQQIYGHYGSQCRQPSTAASSLSVNAPSQSKQTSQGGHFLSELNHLYAQKGRVPSSESDSDVDDLPPPPPELLAPDTNTCNDNTYDVPYNQRHVNGFSNSLYSVPPPPLEYNPYGERRTAYDNGVYGQPQPVNPNENYSMSRVFASQTGTIKRAPPPPKRNNSISTLRNGDVR